MHGRPGAAHPAATLSGKTRLGPVETNRDQLDMTPPLRLRVFLASPGDVADERARARRYWTTFHTMRSCAVRSRSNRGMGPARCWRPHAGDDDTPGGDRGGPSQAVSMRRCGSRCSGRAWARRCPTITASRAAQPIFGHRLGYPRLVESGAVPPHAGHSGLSPNGEMPAGLGEMCGEWCLNKHRHPFDASPDGEDARVQRGGSWAANRSYCRCAYRYDGQRDSRLRSYRLSCLLRAPHPGI